MQVFLRLRIAQKLDANDFAIIVLDITLSRAAKGWD